MNFAANFRRFRASSARNRNSRERGWALISVLWGMSMLSLMAAATMALTITSYRGEKHAFARAEADALLDAGVNAAVLAVSTNALNQRWRVDGMAQRFVFEGHTLSIAVQDEFGRIDLNMADITVLQGVLRGAGADAHTAEILADRISDWRGASESLHRLNGAIDADYAAAGLSYRPRHGPFQSIDEAQLVLGMTPQLFAKLKPALTVYSGAPSIDTSTAPREALLALYGDHPETVDATIAARDGGNLPDGVILNTLRGQIDPTVPLAGRAFTITVRTNIGGRSFTRVTTVRLTGDRERPYLVLAWR